MQKLYEVSKSPLHIPFGDIIPFTLHMPFETLYIHNMGEWKLLLYNFFAHYDSVKLATHKIQAEM